MAHVRVQVFGKLRLQNGDTRLEHFPTRRVEELLGYLLINQKTPIPRDRLVEVLWPDSSPANGRASLSTALWRLKTVFGQIEAADQEYISSTRESIAFSPKKPVAFDLVEFERYLDKAAKAKSDKQRIGALQSAVALYKGGFCEGIYSEWCLVERERLERSYIRALGVLMSIHISQGKYDQAIPYGKKILILDPLREEVHRALMSCYLALDRRVEAVRQFQSCAHLLQRELNVLPMGETIDLYRQIIDERVEDRSSNGNLPTAYQSRLNQAYESFLSAADELNSLIEEGSGVQEPELSN
jgi:DNA-binding SARP family transcriptional activator